MLLSVKIFSIDLVKIWHSCEKLFNYNTFIVYCFCNFSILFYDDICCISTCLSEIIFLSVIHINRMAVWENRLFHHLPIRYLKKFLRTPLLVRVQWQIIILRIRRVIPVRSLWFRRDTGGGVRRSYTTYLDTPSAGTHLPGGIFKKKKHFFVAQFHGRVIMYEYIYI